MQNLSNLDDVDRREALRKIGLAAVAPVMAAAIINVRSPTTDDDATDYLQEAIDRCAAAGGGVVRINRPFICRSARQVGEGTLASLIVWGDNVTLDFGEQGSIEFVYRDSQRYRPIIVGGVGKAMNNRLTLHNSRCIDVPVTSLQGSLAKGSQEIHLPAGLSAKAGDVLFIRSGQLLASTKTEPDAELCVVKSVSERTATLMEPLAKGYTRHLRNWGGGPEESLTQSSPYGLANVTNRVSRNIELRSPRMRCFSCLQLLSIWSVDGFRSIGGELSYNNLGVGARDARMVQWRTSLRHSGQVNGRSYAIAPSTGCTDWDVVWDVVSLGSNYLHIHEGVARSKFSGSLRMAGTDAASAGLSIVARAYDIDISDVLIDTGTSQEGGVLVRGSYIENVSFDRLTVRNNSIGTAAVRTDAISNVRFSTAPNLIGRNKIIKQI